jgi:hypothetical protein
MVPRGAIPYTNKRVSRRVVMTPPTQATCVPAQYLSSELSTLLILPTAARMLAHVVYPSNTLPSSHHVDSITLAPVLWSVTSHCVAVLL